MIETKSNRDIVMEEILADENNDDDMIGHFIDKFYETNKHWVSILYQFSMFKNEIMERLLDSMPFFKD